MYLNPKDECRRNTRLSSDLDNLRSRYLERATITDASNNPIDFDVLSPSFEVYAFEKNRFYLLSNSIPVQFIERWKQRPDYVSFDAYSTVIYWPLILFVNGIDNIEDFKGFDKILVPNPTAAKSVTADRLSKNNIELVTADPVLNQADAFLYKAFLFDDYIASRREAQELLNPQISDVSYTYINQEKTDIFIFTSDIVWNKIVTLTDTPVSASTVEVYMEGFQMPLRYSIDYMMTSDKNVTWSSDYNELLSRSLLNSLANKSGKKLTIKYTVLTTITD